MRVELYREQERGKSERKEGEDREGICIEHSPSPIVSLIQAQTSRNQDEMSASPSAT